MLVYFLFEVLYWGSEEEGFYFKYIYYYVILLVFEYCLIYFARKLLKNMRKFLLKIWEFTIFEALYLVIYFITYEVNMRETLIIPNL